MLLGFRSGRTGAGSLALLVTAGCGDAPIGATPSSNPSASQTSASSGSAPDAAGGSAAGGAGGVGGSGGVSGSGGGAGFVGNFDCDPPIGEVPLLKLTPIVTTGLSIPLLVKSAPGDADRLYVTEKDGRVRIIENGLLLDTPFLDADPAIQSVNGEEGLLGLAFHPDYEKNGRFFVHYSAEGSGDSTVMEYERSADPDLADPSPVRLVLQHPTQKSNHNGGSIEFGPDGFLYVALGDGGFQGDPGCDAMNPANLLGKIIRLDVDAEPGADGYPAAAGNPDGAKYYHVGLRNPWRTSFDVCTGDQYIGDVGQNAWEEVDVAPAGAGPLNFGWPVREGMHDHDKYDGTCPAANGFTEPAAEYSQAALGASGAVIGGYVYRGSAIPGLRGTYIYADFVHSKVFSFVLSGGIATDPRELTDDLEAGGIPLTSFGQDNDGEVYLIYYGGWILRIDAE